MALSFSSIALLVVIGALNGVLAGLLGIGGGLIIVPVLVIVLPLLGVSEDLVMHMALASSMATISLTALSSARSHYKRGSVDIGSAKKLLIGIMVGAFIGTLIAQQLNTRWLMIIFAFFSAVMGVKLWIEHAHEDSQSVEKLGYPNTSAVVMGSISSLVGIGGGSLVVPYLLHFKQTTVKSIGTAAALGFPLAVMATIGYVVLGWSETAEIPWSLGYVYMPAVIVLALGAVLTAPIGVYLAHKLPAQVVRRIFAVLLLAVGIKLLLKAFS